MSRLPEDIIEENILTRLPVKSISRFRCVSRNWRLLFQNPNFIRNHLNHANLMNKFNILVANYKDNDDETEEAPLYSVDNVLLSSTSSPFLGPAVKIDYPFMSRNCRVRFIGSCDGLVCINSYSEGICIWNPATREYKQVPEPSPDPEPNSIIYYAYGFGFDCNNGDYVVLRIVGYRKCDVSEARLYSLRSNSWKNLGSIPYRFTPGKVYKGIFHNNVLHWMATGLIPNVLVCFNISDETFSRLPLPNKNAIEDVEIYMSDLGTWEGKICQIRRKNMEDPDKCKHHVDVWTMMDNKWSKHLKITAQTSDIYYGRPIQTLENGDILLEGGPREEENVGLISYDPKLERARTLVHGFPEDLEVETYIETLVALNSGAYAWQ